MLVKVSPQPETFARIHTPFLARATPKKRAFYYSTGADAARTRTPSCSLRTLAAMYIYAHVCNTYVRTSRKGLSCVCARANPKGWRSSAHALNAGVHQSPRGNKNIIRDKRERERDSARVYVPRAACMMCKGTKRPGRRDFVP